MQNHPSNIGRAVVLNFLNEYGQFGAKGHLAAAEALMHRIRASRDDDERRLLAVKIYAEFIAAMEDIGALCIAIRHRQDSAGLVYAYLTYGQVRRPGSPATKLNKLFEAALDGNGLANALELPDLSTVFRNVPSIKHFPTPSLYEEANKVLAMVAKAYLHDNGAYVRAYNKTKHGFVVVKDEHMFQPDPPHIDPEIAWIVAENPNYHPREKVDQPVVELYSVNIKDVVAMVDRIRLISSLASLICHITKILLSNDIIQSNDDKA